jgi:hypothetical protein
LGVDPDPRIHASDQRIQILLFSSLTFETQKKWLEKSSCLLLLKVHLHHFSKIKSRKKSPYCRN